MNIILLLVYFVFNISGVTFMKLGASNPLSISLKDGFHVSLGFSSLLGYILYIGSFFLWAKLITKFNLSYISPITAGIIQIATVIVAVVILREELKALNFLGLAFIVGGIVLLNVK